MCGSLQQMTSQISEISHQQQETHRKEIHSIATISIITDNLNRTFQFQFSKAKTKNSKVFYSLFSLKSVPKKKDNKLVLAQNLYTNTIIPLSFKQTDIIFPFHNFW